MREKVKYEDEEGRLMKQMGKEEVEHEKERKRRSR